MIPKYINDWLTVIEQMNNDNTYKLAWGRALVECIHNDTYFDNGINVEVDFDSISKCMVKYYWNQQFFFNLKQSPYRDKDPIICKDVNKLIENYKTLTGKVIPTWYDAEEVRAIDSKMFDKTIKHVSKTLHENVCWRFLKIPNKYLDLYQYNKGISKVTFTKEQALLIKDYAVVISKLLNYKWTQLLEKFNYQPKIASKVSGISDNKIRRNNLAKYKDELIKAHGGVAVDFYTGKELDDNDISVDHVIPWSFMYSDDIWNLVLTSKSNNSSKSNSIPDQDIIDRLKHRNEEIKDNVDGKYQLDIERSIKDNLIDRYYFECRL